MNSTKVLIRTVRIVGNQVTALSHEKCRVNYRPFGSVRNLLSVKFFRIFPAGMWGSAFAASLDDICLKVVGIGLSFLDSFKDVIKVVGKNIHKNSWVFQKMADFVVITNNMMQKCAICSFQD